MYSIGGNKTRSVTGIQGRGKYQQGVKRGHYKPRMDKYDYLDQHSGEYDEFERTLIDDPYADGWALCESGKALKPVVCSRWSSMKSRLERVRLFNLGYADAKEYMERMVENAKAV